MYQLEFSVSWLCEGPIDKKNIIQNHYESETITKI